MSGIQNIFLSLNEKFHTLTFLITANLCVNASDIGVVQRCWEVCEVLVIVRFSRCDAVISDTLETCLDGANSSVLVSHVILLHIVKN